MRAIPQRGRIPGFVRAQATVLAPAIAALVLATMSPLGAEVALAGEGSASQRSAGVVYGGTTSNGWPVVVEVTRNGRMIKHAIGGLEADCSRGGSYTFPSHWRYVRIARNGSFKAAYDDSYYLSDGTQATVAESFAGKFNRRRTRLTGTWRNATTFRATDGSTDVCDTGSLRVSARQ
jgi:hypothetical protein